MEKINKSKSNKVKLTCPQCKSKNTTHYTVGEGVKICSCEDCYFEWYK